MEYQHLYPRRGTREEHERKIARDHWCGIEVATWRDERPLEEILGKYPSHKFLEMTAEDVYGQTKTEAYLVGGAGIWRGGVRIWLLPLDPGRALRVVFVHATRCLSGDSSECEELEKWATRQACSDINAGIIDMSWV